MTGTQLRSMILASIFAILVAIGAQIRIPFPIVPLTLQTFFVLLSGMMLGSRWGAISMFLYVMLGLLGLPFFAGGGGMQYLAHPTFGFIASFIPAAWVAGRFRGAGQQTIYYLLAAFLATGVIYTIGLSGLYLNMNYIIGKPVSVFQVFRIGMFPFIPGALIKIFTSALLASKVISRIYRTRGYDPV